MFKTEFLIFLCHWMEAARSVKLARRTQPCVESAFEVEHTKFLHLDLELEGMNIYVRTYGRMRVTTISLRCATGSCWLLPTASFQMRSRQSMRSRQPRHGRLSVSCAQKPRPPSNGFMRPFTTRQNVRCSAVTNHYVLGQTWNHASLRFSPACVW